MPVAGGLPGGCIAGRTDVLAGIETRPGKAKMRHPGTFNTNPLSAAGIATLKQGPPAAPYRHETRRPRSSSTDKRLPPASRTAIREKEVPGLQFGTRFTCTCYRQLARDSV
jgi:glutamate-1-semialdehyde aminotransferase